MIRRIGNSIKNSIASVTGSTRFSSDSVLHPDASFGEFTYGTPNVLGWNEGTKLRVGKYCSFAKDVTIFIGGEHRTDWVSTYPFRSFAESFPNAKDVTGHPSSKGDVVIGNDVWIGHGATILSGVEIGDGAVIGSHSLVTKNVEPYAIFAGNPARLIRKRFPDEDIAFLLKLQWWNWPAEKVNQHVHLLTSANIDELRRIS